MIVKDFQFANNVQKDISVLEVQLNQKYALHLCTAL